MSEKIVNDFSITIGTVNGSGSQTANNTILRSLFKMGIPVSGKNIFPSNIQGLSTWYTIRVNKDGFTARRDAHEIVICMNSNSFSQDLANVLPGGAFFYTDSIKLDITRDDIEVYRLPVKDIMREQKDVPKQLKDLVANMVYVGVLAQSIGIDLEQIRTALDYHFKGKQKPIDLNFKVIEKSVEWAKGNLEKTDPYFVKPMNKNDGLIMTDGNTAAAIGSIYGGVQFMGWYPITPGSSLAEGIIEYLPILRKREDGKHTYAVIQAEDELAAIGMAIGAGFSGLRAMTATSGPGLSLMTEFAGLAYYAEVPVVIWDVQRVGPSTGLPTRTSQGDLTFTHYIGHGDTEQIILLPGNANECFEFGWRAFDIAENLQSPVFVLSDLDLGMNQWMAKPFEYPNEPMDRGKVLWEEDLEKLNGDWGRYRDVDNDGIPYRTVPGNKHPASAYFLRGTGHDENGNLTEDSATWTRMLDRIKKKYYKAVEFIPAPIIEKKKGAKIGIIAMGSTELAVREARHQLETEANIKSDSMRIRGIPFAEDVPKFIESHEQNYVFEMNRDGQLYQLLLGEYPHLADHLISEAFNDGLPATAQWILDSILIKEKI
ncbi:MAG: 2-oxoacid:acceptor oxidoreductase subunit alpha [Anaerolineae bacterium]|nr:2-oxoacid:acceptor oxidoreductase subunit alpha [Anaerolineae bacterium]MDK1081648.1 2-oxoacid:acceptor oxidoreductase subunit alpha [Anaerolineae bacterium]MDK1118257.1 2-oxoacid:acceptor oxidoreductase subunit alpha [Anaerolineae bacterium]